MKLSESIWETTLIAIVTAVMFMCGYLYFETFYAQLRLPYVFGVDTEQLLLYGGIPVFVLVFFLAVVAAFFAAFEGPRRAWEKFLKRTNTSIYHRVLAIVGAFIVAVSVLIIMADHQGKKRADDFLKGGCPQFEIVTTDNASVLGCLVSIRNDVYWLKPIDKSKKAVLVDETLIISQSDIKSAKVVPRMALSR